MTDREALAALLHAEFITHEMGKGSADDRCGLCEQRADHLVAAGVTLTPSLGEGLRTLSTWATPGPWNVYPADRPGIEAPGGSVVIYGDKGGDAGVGTHADAEFIVAAVNFVRRLAQEGETPR